MYADLSTSLSLARKVDGGFAIEAMVKGPGLHAGAGVGPAQQVELQARRKMDFALFTPPAYRAPCSRAVRAGANQGTSTSLGQHSTYATQQAAIERML